ncbi:hypothetical protein ACIP93_06960 [Streptomyces sp. NPDC088745]|uniref:DUF3885 domain-containing protein n=1 Tax=Streptomyces sp. NPDC088745 TaxID=3365884 RepID=UPI0037F15DA5
MPESKRHAKEEGEQAILLDRYDTVLDELSASGEVYVVTTDRADPSEPTDWSAHRAALHPEDALWTVLDDTADPDPDFHAR